MLKHDAVKSALTVARMLCRAGTAVLAGVAIIDICLIIVPFFLLGISHSMYSLEPAKVGFERALGLPAAKLAELAVAIQWTGVAAYLWAVAFVDFLATRDRRVLIVVLFGIWPIAYLLHGPYSGEMLTWVLPI